MSKNITNSKDLDTKYICAKYVNNEEGYDADGYDADGYGRNGYNVYCYNREGKDLLDPNNSDGEKDFIGDCSIFSISNNT
jgi:hypothetical protein